MARRFQNAVSQSFAPRLKGRVVKWNDAKGYGFILRDDGHGDVFVHRNDIEGRNRYRYLIVGQVVIFTLTEGYRGLKATEVVKQTLLGRGHLNRKGRLR